MSKEISGELGLIVVLVKLTAKSYRLDSRLVAVLAPFSGQRNRKSFLDCFDNLTYLGFLP